MSLSYHVIIMNTKSVVMTSVNKSPLFFERLLQTHCFDLSDHSYVSFVRRFIRIIRHTHFSLEGISFHQSAYPVCTDLMSMYHSRDYCHNLFPICFNMSTV
jgi:hypothetical protein